MRFLQWRAAHFKGTSFLFHETCCQDRRLMLEDKSPDDRPQFLGGGLLRSSQMRAIRPGMNASSGR